MKRKRILFAVLLTVLLVTALSVSALGASDEKTSGNYKYIVLSGNTAEITEYTGKESTVTIPAKLGGKKVTSIGYNAFSETESVKKLVISDTVTKIDGAFLHNQSIETIVFGKGVETVDSAFICAAKIKKITVPSANKYFSASDGILYNKAKTKLVYVPVNKGIKNLVIADGVKTLGRNSIRDITLESLTIPSTVKKIESYAIMAYGVKTLTVPGSVAEIENNGIYHCEDLVSLKINNGKLKEISGTAISYCDSLKKIELPKNVSKVGVFMSCRQLEEIAVDKSSPYFKAINGVLFSKDFKTLIKYPQGRKAEKYVIPAFVDKISEHAFYEVADNVAQIYIPKTVESIDETSFGFSYSKIYTDAESAPEKWKSSLVGRTVYYGASFEYEGADTPRVNGKCAITYETMVKLCWKKIPSAKGYIIYQYNSATKKFEKIQTLSASSSNYTVKSLKPTKTYAFRIKALFRYEGEVIYSKASATIKATTVPAVVQGFSAAESGNNIVFTWDKLSGATGYRIFVLDQESGKFKKLKTITSSKKTSYKLKNFEGSAPLRFRIKAYRRASDGTAIWGKSTTFIIK